MKIGELSAPSHNPIAQTKSSTLTQMSEFGSSSLESQDSSAKGPGIISKTINAIVSIPMMLINGVWTLVKYTIYFATLGFCCRPDYDPKALIKGLEKVIDADDEKAAWKDFVKNFPRAVDQLIKLCIEQIREAKIGKGNQDPKQVADWNRENLADARKDLQKRFDDQDKDLLNSAIGYLQKMVDAKAKV